MTMHKIFESGTQPFTIFNEYRQDFPIVVSLPHSGVCITREMNEQLIDGVVLPNTDWYLPELYTFLKEMGITGIVNHMSRYVIDPNRALDASEAKSYKTNLIYKRTTQGYAMYRSKLQKQEVQSRIRDFYEPYHQAVRCLLEEKEKRFGRVYLFDLHSFGLDMGADIVLGNRNGGTTSTELMQFVRASLEQQGLTVQENQPFSGGYITRWYGAAEDCEALQMELWYQTYIDRRDFGNEELPAIDRTLYSSTQQKLQAVFQSLCQRLG